MEVEASGGKVEIVDELDGQRDAHKESEVRPFASGEGAPQ